MLVRRQVGSNSKERPVNKKYFKFSTLLLFSTLSYAVVTAKLVIVAQTQNNIEVTCLNEDGSYYTAGSRIYALDYTGGTAHLNVVAQTPDGVAFTAVNRDGSYYTAGSRIYSFSY